MPAEASFWPNEGPRQHLRYANLSGIAMVGFMAVIFAVELASFFLGHSTRFQRNAFTVVELLSAFGWVSASIASLRENSLFADQELRRDPDPQAARRVSGLVHRWWVILSISQVSAVLLWAIQRFL